MESVLLVNFEQVEMLGGLHVPEVKEILLDLLTSFRVQLPEIDALFAGNAHAQLREEAHKLKGAAKSCGFDALGLHAENLENAAEANELSQLGGWTIRAKELLDATYSTLESGRA